MNRVKNPPPPKKEILGVGGNERVKPLEVGPLGWTDSAHCSYVWDSKQPASIPRLHEPGFRPPGGFLPAGGVGGRLLRLVCLYL